MDTIVVVVTVMFFAACFIGANLYIKRKEAQSDIVKLEAELQRIGLEAPTIITTAQEEAGRVRRESEAYALRLKHEAEVKLADIRNLEKVAEDIIAKRKDEIESKLHSKLAELRQREEASLQELKAKELAISQTEQKMDFELKDKAVELAKLQSLVVAERNRVEGWQDHYILPVHE